MRCFCFLLLDSSAIPGGAAPTPRSASGLTPTVIAAPDGDKAKPRLFSSGAGISKFKASKPSLWGRLIGADGTSTVTVRVEARKGGTSKIKTKYLSDFNLLESTFLIAAIVILLCGVMFKAAEFPPGYVMLTMLCAAM